MNNYQLLGWILLIIVVAIAVVAVWLTGVIIGESYDLKKAVKNVQFAYGNIEIEINKQLLVHNALHYSELLKIIKRVGDKVPGVDITLDRDFENGRVHILIESDGIKTKMSFIGTIVEYGIPRLNETA